MTQRKDESALTFLYRLYIAAERADVDARRTSNQRKEHVLQFIWKRKDDQPKPPFVIHRIKTVADLEYILKHRVGLHGSDNAPSWGITTGAFRPHNLFRDQFRPKRRD
ncbi:Amino acid/auxin permease protein [Phytophthora cinnamomi]|uniref:Amino acid/auxin permease protein n=1 Tax=Phytophthora cinnamomi TaxID=4785 RepID=UPI003559B868|nr:Amino acid/auxin permease protein [Phytophthora cinnamomi]